MVVTANDQLAMPTSVHNFDIVHARRFFRRCNWKCPLQLCRHCAERLSPHIVVLFSRAPVRTLVPLVLASERLLSILSYVRCDARDDISRIRTYQPGCADTSLPIHDRMFCNVFQLGLLISRTIQLRCSRCLILRLKIPSLCLDVYSAYLRDMYSLS